MTRAYHTQELRARLDGDRSPHRRVTFDVVRTAYATRLVEADPIEAGRIARMTVAELRAWLSPPSEPST